MAVDPPLPGRVFRDREVVVIAAREGLEWDQGGIVLEHGDAASRFDVGLGGATGLAFPAEIGAV